MGKRKHRRGIENLTPQPPEEEFDLADRAEAERAVARVLRRTQEYELDAEEAELDREARSWRGLGW